MSRGVAVAIASMFALAALPAAAAPTPPRKALAKKQATKPAKKLAKQPAKKLTAKQKAKLRAKARHEAKRKKRPRVKTTAKPLVQVAKLQVDGRVKYGPDRLPPGFAWPPTKAMQEASKACEQELDTLGVKWKPAAAEGMVAGPVTVPSMQIGGVTYTSRFRRPPPTMDCHFVRVLAQLGPDLRALGVREVQFGSVVRNTLARSHGQTKDFLSRHALGIAMDIKSFVDDSGRVATVENDYLKADPLLHGIEDLINQHTQFRQVLTPGNDPISHDDHFHIEASVDFTTFR